MSMQIRKAELQDVDSIVQIHCSAFDGFFLTTLGVSFLQTYYRALIQSTEALVLCAEECSRIVGFGATAKLAKGFNTRLIKSNIWDFGVVALKLLFVNPKALIRLRKNLSKTVADYEDNGEYAELYSIGVSVESQGKGVGKLLLYETEEILRGGKIRALSLTTDVDDNSSTLGFYNSMGYSVMYPFVAYPKRRMYRLIKLL